MPTDRGKLTAFPTIYRGVAGYSYRVVFTRSYRAPNGERIPANFNGLEARLTIYPANKQGPPLLDLSTSPPNANLFFTLNGANRVALTWFLSSSEVAALTWRQGWGELVLLEGPHRWRWLEGKVVVND
ncbi:MAG: hypothetical protein N2047_08575 [Meiothermus sp.]|nr:hypothetical protein [Meiothermus sp.]